MIRVHEVIGGVLGIAAVLLLFGGGFSSDPLHLLVLCVGVVLAVLSYLAFKIPKWWLLRKGKGKDARR